MLIVRKKGHGKFTELVLTKSFRIKVYSYFLYNKAGIDSTENLDLILFCNEHMVPLMTHWFIKLAENIILHKTFLSPPPPTHTFFFTFNFNGIK